MVRRAVVEDVKKINNLGSLLNERFEKLFIMEEIIYEDVSKVFVYLEDDKVVGFIHVTELKETIDIINLVVDPSYRNKKIASILIDYVITDAKVSVKTITLEVAVDNEIAINLYKNFGFEIVNTRKSYYQGTDAYLMGRVLGE